MATTTVDEFVNTISQLSEADRAELFRRLNEDAVRKSKPDGSKRNGKSHEGKKGFVLHPNTVWIKENSYQYPGQYVVLKDGELIAIGRTIKDAHLAAKSKGLKDTKGYLFHYILAEGEEAYSGGCL